MNELQQIRVNEIDIYRMKVAMAIYSEIGRLQTDAIHSLACESNTDLAVHCDSNCSPEEHACFLVYEKESL